MYTSGTHLFQEVHLTDPQQSQKHCYCWAWLHRAKAQGFKRSKRKWWLPHFQQSAASARLHPEIGIFGQTQVLRAAWEQPSKTEDLCLCGVALLIWSKLCVSNTKREENAFQVSRQEFALNTFPEAPAVTCLKGDVASEQVLNHPGCFQQVGSQCDSCFSSRSFSKQSSFDSSSVAFVLSFGLSEELYLRFVINISFHYLGRSDRLWLFAHIDDSKCCIWTGSFSEALSKMWN